VPDLFSDVVAHELGLALGVAKRDDMILELVFVLDEEGSDHVMLGPCELSGLEWFEFGFGLGLSFHRIVVLLRSRTGCIVR